MKFKLGMHDDLSNDEYHKQRDPDQHFYSSSQLKTMLEDPELFHRKYILQDMVEKENAAFDIGNYYHVAILEPHLLKKEFAIFGGDRRAGKLWDKFKVDNAGKTFLTKKDLIKAEMLIESSKANSIMMGLVQGGQAEVSLFWNLMGLRIKVRFDYIYLAKKGTGEESYIFDLKSTTGNTKDLYKTQNKMRDFSYDLSASLYVDAMNSYIKEKKLDYEPISTFYWGFASKDWPNSKVYASTEKLLAVGRAKCRKAMKLITECIENDWVFEEKVEMLEPLPWEDSWLEVGDGKKRHSNNKEKAIPKKNKKRSML